MRILLSLTLAFFCALTAPSFAQSGSSYMPAPAVSVPAGPSNPDYQLGTGDKVRVNVFGEEDLGGEFVVDGSGFVRLPLVGQVRAQGLSLREFENVLADKLREGYLKDPKVSAEVVNYRPFYIIGEVNKPGEYPYVNYMSILNAVALAGGFTYRANESNVYVRRNGQSKEEYVPADATTKINPGDIIRVPERFF